MEHFLENLEEVLQMCGDGNFTLLSIHFKLPARFRKGWTVTAHWSEKHNYRGDVLKRNRQFKMSGKTDTNEIVFDNQLPHGVKISHDELGYHVHNVAPGVFVTFV